MSDLGMHTDGLHSTDPEDESVSSSRIRVQDRLTIPSNRLNLILFFVVALFYCGWIIQKYGFSLTNGSGDADDIWRTITTWGTDEVYYSYVLYKGLFSLQPYLWLYRIATALGLPDQSLIVVFFSLLYAYSSVYGFPAVIAQLVGNGKPVDTWKRALFAIAFFQLTQYTYAYSQLMVDLPSMTAFLMMLHLAICLPDTAGSFKHGIGDFGKFLAAGLCVGVCLGFSGQYSVATCCVIIFILIKIIRLAWGSRRRADKYVGVCTLLLVASAAVVVMLNREFNAMIAREVAATGGEFRTGKFWMERNLYLGLQRYMNATKKIPDPRLTQIAYNMYGKAEAIQLFEVVQNYGDNGWTIREYLGAASKYPVDFICSWLNHFLCAMSMDRFHQYVPGLLVGYTSLYIALYGFVTKVKRWGDIFNRNFWIVTGFLCVAILSVVMQVEPRYTISIVGLFLGYAVCGDILWHSLGAFCRSVYEIAQSRSFASLKNKKAPMGFFAWIVFLVILLSWYAALMENCGVDVDILFHWR